MSDLQILVNASGKPPIVLRPTTPAVQCLVEVLFRARDKREQKKREVAS